jgi:hypothetical protein
VLAPADCACNENLDEIKYFRNYKFVKVGHRTEEPCIRETTLPKV